MSITMFGLTFDDDREMTMRTELQNNLLEDIQGFQDGLYHLVRELDLGEVKEVIEVLKSEYPDGLDLSVAFESRLEDEILFGYDPWNHTPVFGC